MSSNKWTENYRKGEQPVKTPFKRDDDTVEKVLKVSTWGDWPGVATEKTMKKFGVRVRYSEKTGDLCAIYCPAYDSTCTKIVGYQKKDLTKDKNDKFHFVACGTVNIKNAMFFQPQANPSSNHVYICEGFKDALALYQTLHDKTREEYRKFLPGIVSITLGCPNAKMNILHNEHFIKQYVGEYTFKKEQKQRGPVLCFDNDCSSPFENEIKGHEATEECAFALSDYYVKVLKHPDDINDIHDYVRTGRQQELFDKAIFQCTEYKPSKIVSLYDVFEPGELKKPIEKGVYLPSYPKLMDLLLGDRQGELTLILAPSGVGKTLITADMLYEYMIVEGFCGGVFLEEDLKKTFQRFISRRMQMNLRNFRLGLSKVDDERYNEAEKWLSDPDVFLAVANDGKIKISELETSLKLFKRRYNRKKVVVDHLMLTQSDDPKKSDLKQLDDSMERIAGICSHEYISANLIAHVNRGVAFDRKRDITQPTWVRTFKEDARGCLSNDSRYLAKGKGWKRFDEYDEEDEILQYNQDGTVEFVKPKAFIEMPCDEMWEFKSKSLSMKLSDEHRVIYRERKKGSSGLKEITANDLVKRSKSFKGGFGGQIPKTFKKVGGYCKYTEQELRVQVMINADGCIINHNTGHCCIGVKKERKKQRVVELLGGRLTNRYDTKDNVSLFYTYMPMSEKGFTEEYYNFDQEALEIIIDELQYWDCTIKTRRFSSVEKRDVDFISYAYSCCGYRTNTTYDYEQKCNDGRKRQLIHYVNVCKNIHGSLRSDGEYSNVSIERVKTQDGKKYCFTTDSGMFVAQRDGKIFVTGNSSSIECLSYNVICIDIEILPSGRRGRIRLRLDKNREGGDTGSADILMMDYKTGLMINAEDWVYDKEKGIMVSPGSIQPGY